MISLTIVTAHDYIQVVGKEFSQVAGGMMLNCCISGTVGLLLVKTGCRASARITLLRPWVAIQGP